MGKKLFKISLAMSLISILFLLLLSNISEPKKVLIKKIDDKMVGERIKLLGNASEFQEKNKLTIFELNDGTGRINVICKCEITAGTKIITGKIQKYKNSFQLSADKIISMD